MYSVVTARKGISFDAARKKEIPASLQKTAWFILGRLREACGEKRFEKLSGITIEIDEAYTSARQRKQQARVGEARTGKHDLPGNQGDRLLENA